jgi:hypothetical protein
VEASHQPAGTHLHHDRVAQQQRANAQLTGAPEARLDLQAGHETKMQTDVLTVRSGFCV